MYKLSLIMICLFTFSVVHSHSENLFSSFNRYDLSYKYFKKNAALISDSLSSVWFSTPEFASQNDRYVSISNGEQKLTFDFNSFTGYEYHTKSNRFIGLSINSTYHSSFLNAYITSDAYTTENRINSPVNDIRYERFIKSNFNKPISGVFDFRFNLPEAYLELHHKNISLSIGKQKVRWGPGYKGTLGLSGTTYSPFYYYNFILNFGDMLRMQAFLNGYDDESIYSSELETREDIRIKATERRLRTYFPRYCAGQRLDLQFSEHVQIGIYELVDFFGGNELNRFANPLQLYYLSNEASGTNNANLLGGIDFNIIFKPLRFYGEFLNDDITVFEDAGNPNKYAMQLGVAYFGKKPLLQTGIEYTHIARYVYGHSRVLSRHAHWGESMGWPWGNYQDVFTAYVIFAFQKNIYGKVEANYWIKGDGDLKDDWYADGSPDLDHAPYWPENSTKIFSAILSAQYSPFPWMTYSFYWEPVIEEKTFSNGFYTYLRVGIPGKKVINVD